jgi:hypothetical protein
MAFENVSRSSGLSVYVCVFRFRGQAESASGPGVSLTHAHTFKSRISSVMGRGCVPLAAAEFFIAHARITVANKRTNTRTHRPFVKRALPKAVLWSAFPFSSLGWKFNYDPHALNYYYYSLAGARKPKGMTLFASSRAFAHK